MKVFVFAAGLLVAGAANAAGFDLHQMWDDRCQECHGHAGDFARKWLRVSDHALQGRHHVHDLREFLNNHYLARSEVDAVYDMLLAQAGNPPRFREQCSRCHHTAAEFVRAALEMRDGVLYNRGSGLLTREFLARHQKLTANDADFFHTLLARITQEVNRP